LGGRGLDVNSAPLIDFTGKSTIVKTSAPWQIEGIALALVLLALAVVFYLRRKKQADPS
jgi:uncharacterized membrane protein (DUF373 family)